MKTCKQCQEIKPLCEFYRLPHTTDRHNYRCIRCQNAYNREYNRKRALAKIDPRLIATFKEIRCELQVRFPRFIEISDTGCWHWTGNLHPTSKYGRFWVDGKTARQAHRLAFLWSGGVLPDDLVIDHLCRNRACVNPAHLEPVTNVENVMRGESIWAKNARKTHCLRGHEFTPENTWTTKEGLRHCRECTRIRKRERRARLSATESPG